MAWNIHSGGDIIYSNATFDINTLITYVIFLNTPEHKKYYNYSNW